MHLCVCHICLHDSWCLVKACPGLCQNCCQQVSIQEFQGTVMLLDDLLLQVCIELPVCIQVAHTCVETGGSLCDPCIWKQGCTCCAKQNYSNFMRGMIQQLHSKQMGTRYHPALLFAGCVSKQVWYMLHTYTPMATYAHSAEYTCRSLWYTSILHLIAC